MSKNIIIYGFGRMGLTHYAILNQLLNNANFVFIDPNRRVNFFVKKNLSAKIYNSDNYLSDKYDFALVCTPPTFHIPILNSLLEKNTSNIFVEKPFGGINDNFSLSINSRQNISIGYVLRFNTTVQWVKSNIDINDINKVEGYYFSNTLEKKPKGWRNGKYSGVTNEIGSHIIDLCIYLFGMSKPDLIKKDVYSVISDVDDVLIADLQDKSIKYHLHFDWVNKNYRKPVFKFVLYMKDGSIFKFDQQKIEHFQNNSLINKITSVDLINETPYYLRGLEFTRQLQDFISS
jgi:predicted dehydrogenase